MPSVLRTTVAALASASVAVGHTWIEQLRNIDEQGNYVGQYGYARGMVGKSDPGFNGDSMNFNLPAAQNKAFIDETTPLCHPAQTKQVQSSDRYPRLKASPGGFMSMRYSENGHVTLVDPATGLGKPEKGGTVFVYGTTQPKEDEKLVDVLRWTEDGQGGDKRGKIVAMNNFDDGRCYEINSTPIHAQRVKLTPNYAMGQASDKGPGNFPLNCETNVQLPETAEVGKPYTFYWVWQWNTAPGGNPAIPAGKDEYYTTCIDVDVVSAQVASAADARKASPKFALGQQDAMSVAVKDFASRTAIITAAVDGEVGPIFSSKPSPTAGAPSGVPSQGTPANSTGKPSRTRSRRPRPTRKPEDGSGGNTVVVTDTVWVTVTAQPSQPTPPAGVPSVNPKPSSAAVAPPVAGTPSPSRPLPAPGSPSPSRVPPAPPAQSGAPAQPVAPSQPAQSVPPAASATQPGAPAPSGQLPGFQFGKPPSAKFRRRYM